METKNSLFKNTIYKSLLSMVNIVVPLIIGPYIMRLLDTELYGVYNKVYADYQIFLVFASFGIYTLGVREISKIRNDEKTVSKLFTNLFLISFLSNIVVLIIYIIFSFNTSSGITRLLYLIMAIQIVANIFYVEFVNEAIENYRFIAIKSVIVKIIYFIAVILWVRKPQDVVAYALIVSLVNFINNITSFIYAKKRIKFDFSEIKIKKYIKPLIAVLVISNADLLYSQLDKVMLGNYVSNISVTEYYIAYYLISTLYAIPYSVINVSVPRLSYLLENEGKKAYEKQLNKSISSLLFITLPMCFGVFVLAYEAVKIYSGDKYPGLEIPLMIACMGRIILAFQSVIEHLVLYPNNKEKRILIISFTGGICNLIINYLLVLAGLFNPSTALISTSIIELLICIMHYIYAKKKLNINVSIFNKYNCLYLFLSILFIPISLFIRRLNLGFYMNMGLIIIVCVSMYYSVLYIKKDENLDLILRKLKLRR